MGRKEEASGVEREERKERGRKGRERDRGRGRMRRDVPDGGGDEGKPQGED